MAWENSCGSGVTGKATCHPDRWGVARAQANMHLSLLSLAWAYMGLVQPSSQVGDLQNALSGLHIGAELDKHRAQMGVRLGRMAPCHKTSHHKTSFWSSRPYIHPRRRTSA